MKDYWKKIELKFDALTLRQRAMAFAIGTLLLLTLVNVAIIDPLNSREKQLSQQIKLDQQQIAAMQTEIQLRVATHAIDPDAPTRLRLQQLQRESTEIREQLTGVQKALIAPERMPALLEDLLKRHGRLRLQSLKTMPVTQLNEAEGASATARKDSGEQSSDRDAVYKHGVSIVVQGSYPDLLEYLGQIEAMPWELFWDRATLQVDAYPTASLSLTLFTLSLDRKWLNI